MLAREVDATAGRAIERIDRTRLDVEQQADTLLAIIDDTTMAWEQRRARLRSVLPRVRQVRAEALNALNAFTQRLRREARSPNSSAALRHGSATSKRRSRRLRTGSTMRSPMRTGPEAAIRAAIVELKQKASQLANDLKLPIEAVRHEIQRRIGELTFGDGQLTQWPGNRARERAR